jgi:hypothetical protein
MKSSCENLTSAIQNLQTLQRRVDLAIRSFEPKDGVLAKVEAQKIFEQYLFSRLFKKEAYDYFTRVLGGEEGLKKRVGDFKTTGKTGSQLKVEFSKKKLSVYPTAADMLGSKEFEVVKPGEKIFTLRIEVRTLFSDHQTHTYAEILARADKLGLEFLPHETVADLLMNKELPSKTAERLRVVSKPIRDRDGRPALFNVSDSSLRGEQWARPGDKWAPGYGLILRLRRVAQNFPA